MSEPIAVVGMAGRFPGADNVAGLREVLREGRDAIREVPPDRWDVDELYDPDNEPGRMHTRRIGSLDGIDLFDPQFFGISRREASRMDPQQRILLEVSWEALEAAGIAPASLAGTPTGVFVGIWGVEYTLDFWNRTASPAARRKRLDGWVGAGNAHCIAANRISFLLDLRGPSIAVDTACSSSLVSLHLACQSVWSGESDLALAAGVNVLIPPDTTIAASQAQMLSADGRCKSFDARADGYVRSEGCGVILIKRLSDAIRDGDHVHALIRGTATNQDGRTSALTVPSAEAQESVMRRALATAGIDPSDLSYFEAHGTGTPIGDPTEVRAIASVLGPKRTPEHRCLLGSLKANIGHLETASGIASVIKVILGLEHEEIYPQINLERLNPKIRLEGTPLEIPSELEPWRRGNSRRVAGVNSFGFGGANAHVLLEEAPARTPRPQVPERPRHVLALSARGEEPLRDLAARFRETCAGAREEELPDICFTAGAGRNHFERRLAVTGETPEEICAGLDAFTEGARGGFQAGEARPGSRPRLAFLFPGQGAQYAGMALGLREREPVFRDALDVCAEILDDLLDRPLLSLLETPAGGRSVLDETRYTQPALFAVEYALAELWASWGVSAEFACGHSVGEYVAACVAGVLGLEDALRLMARRAELMGGLPAGGAMAAVLAGHDRVAEAIAPYAGAVAVAAVNGPASVTISGAAAALADATRELEGGGMAVRRLAVSHAFHSPLMDPILDELEAAAAKVEHSEPALRLASNLTGRLFEPGERPDAAYWRAHTRNPVRFAGCIEALAEAGADVFLELGPSPTLIGLGKRCAPGDGLLWLPSLKRGSDDDSVMGESLAALYARGVPVDWVGRDRGRARRRLRLPTYPFQRTRYWNDQDEDDGPGAAAAPVAEQGTHPLLGARLAIADPAFQSRLSLTRFPYLTGHAVQGSVVLPAACYLELGAAAGGGALTAVEFKRPLCLSEDGARTLQVLLGPEEGGERAVRIHSSAGDGEWTLHAVGRVGAGEDRKPPPFGLDAFRSRAEEEIPGGDLYEALGDFGLQYGSAFRAVTRVWRSEGEALGRLHLPEDLGGTDGYRFHPALLDACLHVVAPAIGGSREAADAALGPVLPVGVERFALYGEPALPLWVHARLRHEVTADDRSVEADVVVYEDTGDAVAEIVGLRLQRLDLAGAAKGTEDPRRWMHRVEWEEAAGPDIEDDRPNPIVVANFADDPRDGTGPPRRAPASVTRLLELTRELAEHPHPAPQLVLVTRGAQAVTGDDASGIAPDQAALWGLMMSVIHEQPQLRCRAVDLGPSRPEGEAELLAHELRAASDETHVALRDGRRFVARLRHREDAGGRAGTTLRGDATYLITGGLGSLGLAVARWMIGRGARHLVLVSRRSPSGSTARAVEELREAGAEVNTVAADVANPEDVRRALDLPAGMPPLRGIVHSAGVLDDGLVTELDHPRVARVMAPKAAGAWNLHLATADRELDFFVLFSSVIGVLGAPAQASYAAANAFLDALAHLRRSQGLPAVSIDWSGWSEIGMAAEASRNGRSIISEVGTLSPEQGVEALGRLLDASEPQVAVLPFRWGRWRELFPSFSRSPLLRELVEAEAEEHRAARAEDLAAASRILAAGEDERPDLIAAYLQQELARVLETEPEALDVDAPLTHVGLDSLMALEVKNRVETTHGIELPIVGLIEDPTITNLATQVAGLLTGSEAEPGAGQADGAEEAAAATAEILETLDELSDQELDALLGPAPGGTDQRG
jgi:acyl transferase domain-containing protein/aryl carrier-like protein